ncbi:uncharacterized protein LOC5575033 [Aedes aegypti]|uniref:Uncharacterized protein n=1 Tax=Aedes aegypti TaxID=7159 RepID=A0A1S4FTL7_AEDAE|nr:uncharacterized protein LOC5575033 [Aedes aegypti]
MPLAKVLSQVTVQDATQQRQKRALIFPRGNPTRHQLVAGFGIPVDIVLESVTAGYVFKAVYFLPWNSSHWIPQFLRRDEDLLFEPPEQVQSRNFVDMEPGEQYRSEDGNGVDDAGWAGRTRWEIYRMLETMADQKGYNGRSCLLRTICEAAEVKFSHSSGIIGELLHILLTPSTTQEATTHHHDEEYRRAELVASRSSPRTRLGGSVCSDMYAECPFSLLDLFSGTL